MFTKNIFSKITFLLIAALLAFSTVQPAFAVGSNDNFENAKVITSLPFYENADTYGATYQGGEAYPGEAAEPYPSCGYGYTPMSVWYAYTPTANTSMIAQAEYYYFPPVLAVYTGTWGNLTEVACRTYSNNLGFLGQAGVTYYFQLSGLYSWDQGPIPFSLHVTPPPQVDIYYDPYSPSIYSNCRPS